MDFFEEIDFFFLDFFEEIDFDFFWIFWIFLNEFKKSLHNSVHRQHSSYPNWLAEFFRPSWTAFEVDKLPRRCYSTPHIRDEPHNCRQNGAILVPPWWDRWHRRKLSRDSCSCLEHNAQPWQCGWHSKRCHHKNANNSSLARLAGWKCREMGINCCRCRCCHVATAWIFGRECDRANLGRQLLAHRLTAFAYWRAWKNSQNRPSNWIALLRWKKLKLK